LTGNVANSPTPAGAVERALDLNGGDRDAALKTLQGNLKASQRQDARAAELGITTAAPQTYHYEQAIDLLNSGYKGGGSMYQVQIHADPEHFLDWDKPLSEQHPKVQEAMRGLGVGPNKPSSLNIDTMERSPGSPMSGEDAYRALENKSGQTTLLKRDQPASAYEALRDAGIPGIKYLDAGSRGKGDGTRNFVTFSDDIISILKKYGLAGLGLGTGAGLARPRSDDGT
jgi:hypothetical protein